MQRSFFDVAMQFSFVAAQLWVKMTSALQKSKGCSATSATQLSEIAALSLFSLVACLEVIQPPKSGLERGVFWKRGLFRKVHVFEILES